MAETDAPAWSECRWQQLLPRAYGRALLPRLYSMWRGTTKWGQPPHDDAMNFQY